MSRTRKPGKSLLVRPGYEVGYGKPPMNTRFGPGQSGNPGGRPKGSRNKRPGLHEERLKDIILDEAYRGIAVRDGHRMVTIPVAQAMVRSLAINAAKGQAHAQRLFAELLVRTESDRRTLNDRWVEMAIEYKLGWEKELHRRKALGIMGLPEPLPHPDHVEIDLDEGTARVIGPRTKEEKAAFDDVVNNRHLLINDLREIYQALKAVEDHKERRKLEKAWHDQLELIGIINKLSPRTPET